MKRISILTGAAGLILMLGSAGAAETSDMALTQLIFQMALAMGLLLLSRRLWEKARLLARQKTLHERVLRESRQEIPAASLRRAKSGEIHAA